MPVFLCRWPNGDFSIVSAPNKNAAVEELDEIGNAEGCPMRRIRDFQVHFRLADDGQLVFEQFGEATIEAIMSFCYPLLEQAHMRASDAGLEEPGDADPEREAREEQARLAAAVLEERERVKPRPGPAPATELGRQLAQQLDAPASLIDRYTRQAAAEVLQKVPPPADPDDVQ